MSTFDLYDEMLKAYRKAEKQENKLRKHQALCKECALMISLVERQSRGGYCMTCESEINHAQKTKQKTRGRPRKSTS